MFIIKYSTAQLIIRYKFACNFSRRTNALSEVVFRFPQIGQHKYRFTIATQQKRTFMTSNSLLEWALRAQQIHKQQWKFIGNSCRRILQEIRTLFSTMMNFLSENPCKSTCNAKTSWWQVINSKQVKDFIVEMPFCARIYFPLEVSSRFLSKRSHIFQMLKSEWKSYFIQPSPTLRMLSSERRVEEGKLHNELHTIVKNTGNFACFFVVGKF